MGPDPWYRDSVIYAVDISKYADSDGDGIGDIPGLIDKIEYIDELGVDCIWLLPFYPSPRRDNGYDVTNHYSIDPLFGTLEDFERLVRVAGERGMRIMIDVVMDHTSDQHPWFQAARRDRGSRYRDYYTWVDVPPRGGLGHGSAFPGEEYSLWKFDEVAGQYYYHPFYRFQPQLNMSNPEVRNELFKVLDFWMSLGVSGFRLDAVPLMLGLDGPAVNPPRDPHEILRDARRLVSGRGDNVILMGEVDQHTGKLVGYFGEGDELNSLLNFTLDNYLFLGLATEKAAPVLRGLRLLPAPPDRCQWVNFLRNLDELNIQWLPESDRNTVWDLYAPDPDMRIYDRGIRRRLAPMIGDPRKLEMAFSLLLSLPGTPMFVYGDEIGLGERLDLPGRDACRTPMQWNDGPNAGFSSSDKGLSATLVTRGPYSYKKVNVEAQSGQRGSLLERVRTLVAARRDCVELGRGVWHSHDSESEAVLAHRTVWRDKVLMMVHNLGGKKETHLVDLSDHRGEHLERLICSGIEVDRVSQGVYRLTIPPYGYGWYRLVDDPIRSVECVRSD